MGKLETLWSIWYISLIQIENLPRGLKGALYIPSNPRFRISSNTYKNAPGSQRGLPEQIALILEVLETERMNLLTCKCILNIVQTNNN